MWHKIDVVAQSNRLNKEAFTTFAKNNFDKYGLIDEVTGIEVNTWYVNDMVKDYRHLVQCDGCKQRARLVNGLHQDTHGRTFMACTATRYV